MLFEVEKDVDIENFLTKYFDGKQIKVDFFKKEDLQGGWDEPQKGGKHFQIVFFLNVYFINKPRSLPTRITRPDKARWGMRWSFH